MLRTSCNHPEVDRIRAIRAICYGYFKGHILSTAGLLYVYSVLAPADMFLWISRRQHGAALSLSTCQGKQTDPMYLGSHPNKSSFQTGPKPVSPLSCKRGLHKDNPAMESHGDSRLCTRLGTTVGSGQVAAKELKLAEFRNHIAYYISLRW